MYGEIRMLNKNLTAHDQNAKILSVDSLELNNRLMEAMNKSQAVIEFTPDGVILNANANFLNTLGYSLDEIQGKHHRIFCDMKYSNSTDYQEFWNKLKNGQFDARQYPRIKKDGKIIWIQASYNPVIGIDGKVERVVKFATDITEEKFKQDALTNAIDKSQAVIEFNSDGIIQRANNNFLAALGYTFDEIQGKHHRIFCDNKYTSSPEYAEFWSKLKGGTFDARQYPRIRKDGKIIWIQASYNPVLGIDGKVERVVKYASDITREKEEWFNLLKVLGNTSHQLAAAAEELTATSNQLLENAQKSSDQSTSAAAATEEVDSGVRSVATNMEEMSASIKEITRTTNETSQMAGDTLKKSQDTNQIINQLGVSSNDIGNVVKVISAIAQQTNLLALNATIEAARAGESGRGFAVVANEVKELAKQTAKATGDITKKIETIQADTKNAVQAIGAISNSIEKVNGHASNIAAAVEEQAATTNEISRIILESSSAIGGVSSLVKDVAIVSTSNKTDAMQLKEASTSLSRLALELKDLVSKLN